MTTKWITEQSPTQRAGTDNVRYHDRACWNAGFRGPANDERTVRFRRRRALKVLVVANARDRSHGLDQLVKDMGHDVSAVHPGSAALALARARQPDVALLDIDVPVPGWCQLAGPLRNELSRADCLIIAFSRKADRECRRQCLRAGIDLVLSVPVIPSVLETLLWMECTRVNRLLSTAARGSVVG
jgi:CheY-like chemotaxis protein